MGTQSNIVHARTEKGSWFQRNPKKSLLFISLCVFIMLDRAAGYMLIPRDYNIFRSPHPFYHHDLVPNSIAVAKWGDTEYPMFTNSLGFRDDDVKTIAFASSSKRILVMGDSFVEGIGVPYEQSVAGILQQALRKSNIEVLNAAVISYSPKLYYLKTLELLEQRKLEFDELLVFIDISDIQNEIAYEFFEPAPFPVFAKIRFELNKYLSHTSFFYAAFRQLLRRTETASLENLHADGLFPCLADIEDNLLTDENFRKTEGIWTVDEVIYEQFGKKGLSLAKKNMQKLVALCQKHQISVTLVVYPWPAQLIERDLESIQVAFWKTFAEEHHLGFINLFPAFINELDPQGVYVTYFIPGDVHWNAAGNHLVAQKVFEYLTQ